MMVALSILFVIGVVACVFIGKTIIAAAVAHVEETYPDEYAKLSRHGLLPFKGLSGDTDRARRGLAGPLLTGFLPKAMRDDPVLQHAKFHWRLSFAGIFVCFFLAMITLSRA
ncbi:hypothetical protein KHP62_20390 [Rhodobacteraceae bacterium NNCM2]|nr:hypothetical protein [Coraliihabitans acroporae]